MILGEGVGGKELDKQLSLVTVIGVKKAAPLLMYVCIYIYIYI